MFSNLDIYALMIHLLVMFLAFPIHECAHAFVAMKLGDNTAKYQGRVTLNPISHLSVLGSVMMILVGFGWAKPVPVNPLNFTHKISRKTGMALTALAGPVSNLLLAFVFVIIFKLLPYNVNPNLAVIILQIVLLNLGLAIFNLIPCPPLDGSRILLLILNERQYFNLMRYEMFFFMGIMFLFSFGLSLGFIDFIEYKILGVFDFLTGWVDMIAKAIY
ncbi:MAG: site-2 protease family protein [Oscillospiraceae bacterium]|jgi:Zn-dependent protease|nr:site-2 protease family protein [Oscillospiraceae bacterium]